MPRSTCIGAALAIIAILSLAPAAALAQRAVTPSAPGDPLEVRSDTDLQRALQHWEDMIHYFRIANHDLAVSAGEALEDESLNAAELLRVVEELSGYEEYERTLRRAVQLGGEPGQMAQRWLDRLRGSRLDVAREGTRIRESIEQLDRGLRHRQSAYDRLRRAGEYAAPELLAVLLSDGQRNRELQPYVIDAMVHVGRPMVAPLSEAMQNLPPVPRQQVAEVLGRIGYPLALPYLRAELERENLGADGRRVIERAYERIIADTGTPRRSTAADLFLRLAEDYYEAHDSLILQPNAPYNLMWTFGTDAGLNARQVPTPIFHDAMAMRTSRRALQLNPNLSPALSLWVTANFRRENNLPEGEQDPTYGSEMRSPRYYATLAGPRHLHPVLQRALRDRDSHLALDAIEALNSTATAESLLNLDGRMQPLIAALNYPDRRVRFDAAIAIASARPTESFGGGQRVIPVLAEAIREAGELYAVALGEDESAVDRAYEAIASAGDFRTLRGAGIDVVRTQVAEAPGVDLVVVRASYEQALDVVSDVRNDYKMMATPVVVLAAEGDAGSLRRALQDDDLVSVISIAQNGQQISAAIQDAATRTQGSNLTSDEADYYASTALDLLRDIKARSNPVFDPEDARAALLAALDDPREQVVLKAAEILTLFSAQSVQRTLADKALATDRGEAMQIAFLRRVGRSAREHGNQLSQRQMRDLVSLVEDTPPGDLADAAASLHGALNLTTRNVVDIITR